MRVALPPDANLVPILIFLAECSSEMETNSVSSTDMSRSSSVSVSSLGSSWGYVAQIFRRPEMNTSALLRPLSWLTA